MLRSLAQANDETVVGTFHKTVAVLAKVSEAMRERSRSWLREKGWSALRLPISPSSAAALGLLPEAATLPDWVGGNPLVAVPGWRNMKRYLPKPMPPGWRFRAHRSDGAVMIDTGDGTVLTMSGAKGGGKQRMVKASLGHERDLPIDAFGVLARLQGVGRFEEVEPGMGQRFFFAPIR